MSDDRPADDPVAALAKLRSEFDDFKSTIATRAQRRPTGDIERTLRTIPKPDTLFCQGQTLNRADYPVLWQWIVDQGLSPSVFGAGNGTTTFVLPNAQGRVEVAAGTLGSDTYAVGAAGGSSTKTLSVANMPAHDHNVSGSTGSDSHSHSGSTGGGGSHSGHSQATETTPGGQYGGLAAYDYTRGDHSHSLSINSDTHSHTLSISESTVGSGTAFDVRQAYIVTNLAIWV